MSEETADADIDFSAADDAEGEEALNIALDGFEGPLHLLLELARAKKLDITRMSVTEIADQYLAFIAAARARNIEIAGDYLVMAAWLTLLKSRLLLPAPQRPADEPDPDQLAAHLRLKLINLELARAAARRLEDLPQLDRDVFMIGMPQPVKVARQNDWRASLHELLGAYCAERTKSVRHRAYTARPRRAFPLEAARRRLEEALTKLEDWRALESVAPHADPSDQGPEAPPEVSYLASTFAAALELAREHKVELRQAEPLAPLYLRARLASDTKTAEGATDDPANIHE